MADGERWAQLHQRLAALDLADAVDGVADVLLAYLTDVRGVVRAGVAVSQGAGRRLAFLPSERLGSGDDRWCEIDGLADVPLAHALLTGRPVLLRDLDELGRDYPQLLRRQSERGTCALAALPLAVDDARLGAVMVTYSDPQPLEGAELDALTTVAALTARALHRIHSWAEVDDLVAPPADADPDARSAATRLPAGSRGPRTARHFLAEWGGRWGLPADVLETAALCLSEVVTNAVIHAGTAVDVTLALQDGQLLVAVRDRGTRGLVHRRAMPEADDVAGRGLLLVDALTASWGAEQSRSGTTVWFELALTGAPTPR